MLIPNAWKLQAPAKCYASGTTCVSTGPRARSRAPERHCTRSGRKLRALTLNGPKTCHSLTLCSKTLSTSKKFLFFAKIPD